MTWWTWLPGPKATLPNDDTKSYWSFTHHNVPTPKKFESSNLRVPESTQNIDSYVLIIYQIDNTVSLILWSLNIWENCWIKTFSKLLSTPSLTDILSLQSEEITKNQKICVVNSCLPSADQERSFFHWAFSKKIYSWLPVVGNRHSFSKKAPMSSRFIRSTLSLCSTIGKNGSHYCVGQRHQKRNQH